MITIKHVLDFLNEIAPPSLQESYDNAGLLTGDPDSVCTGILCCLDVTEQVLDEAALHGANLVVAHHPLIFKPLKNILPTSANGTILIKAIRQGTAILAIHTNYDNVGKGVNFALSRKIGLPEDSFSILTPMGGQIAKLYTAVPVADNERVKSALFAAGAGKIGLYDQCSFQTSGTGTFRPLPGSNPVIGESGGPREQVEEYKLEVIFPIWRKKQILAALRQSHPYEEVAYEIILTENLHQEIGSGMLGTLSQPLTETGFLKLISSSLAQPFLRHSALTGKMIRKVAVCGGAGAFLIGKAIQSGADAFLTADLKYHEFFDADAKILLVDAGHFETENPAIAQLTTELQEKFPTFAVLKSKVNTNPVHYFGI